MLRESNPAAGKAPPGRRRGPPRGEISAVYDYTDEQGTLLFQVLRYRPKAFRARRPDGRGGWLPSLGGVRRVLYRLRQVLAAGSVLVLEGEKDVETAEGLPLPPGWAATSSPFGACQWRSDYTRMLAGKAVYLCPDNDRAGRDHLAQVGLALTGTAREVKVVSLPPAAKDLSDWVRGGGDSDAFAELLRSAEPFAHPPERIALTHALQPLADAAGEYAAVYNYTDSRGSLLFQVARLRPKDFRTRRPDGRGGWLSGLSGLRPVLYRLTRIVAADKVLVVEGEKDVETAERLSLAADWAVTCNPFGVCQWRDEYSAVLAGKAVHLCPDNDAPGRAHMLQVGLSLLGQARDIRVVTLPAGSKDLSEWVASGGDADAFAHLLCAAETFPYPRDPSEAMRAIEPLDDALATVSRLRGVVCRSATPGVAVAPEIGFVPEELALVLPGWVGRDADGRPAVCVRGFEALAVAALQKLAVETQVSHDRARILAARLERLDAAAAGSNSLLDRSERKDVQI